MPAPPAPPLNLKPLTTLRIIAALWVMLADYWQDLRGTSSATPIWITSGHLGVDLFFVLSGFIVCHRYLLEFGYSRFSYKRFLWARLARIYPLHIATLLAVGLMAAAAIAFGQRLKHDVLYWPALPANLLLTNAWGFNKDAGWNHAAWSISAEWFAYLLFPGFAATAWSLRSRPILASSLAALLLLVIYPTFRHIAGFELTDATIAWGALRVLPCFAYGSAMYLLWRSAMVEKTGVAMFLTLFFAIFCALLVTLSAPTSMIIMSFGGIIFGLASLSSTGSTLFSNRVGVYLGEISFSVYMVTIPWKMLVISVAQKIFHMTGGLPLLLWLLYFSGTIMIGMAAHHFVEDPARKFLRSLAARAPKLVMPPVVSRSYSG